MLSDIYPKYEYSHFRHFTHFSLDCEITCGQSRTKFFLVLFFIENINYHAFECSISFWRRLWCGLSKLRWVDVFHCSSSQVFDRSLRDRCWCCLECKHFAEALIAFCLFHRHKFPCSSAPLFTLRTDPLCLKQGFRR